MSAELTGVILLGLGCAANPWGISPAVSSTEVAKTSKECTGSRDWPQAGAQGAESP